MKIEPITRATASAASHIYAASWKVGYRGIVPQEYLDALSPERWTDKLGNGDHAEFREDYLLSENGRPIAASSICAARDAQLVGWGELMSIYVQPDVYRRGYGRALFTFAVNRLRENGYSKIYLWMLEENRRARSFYEAMGFCPNGDRIEQVIGGRALAELRYVRAFEDAPYGTKQEETNMEQVWKDMYAEAKKVLNPRKISEMMESGGVAAAIEAGSGKIYTGVCVDGACTLGICAERNAMFHMITCGESVIRRVVAINWDGKAMPPCGACRELMTQMMPENYRSIEVMLDYDAPRIVTLGELTPEWWI